MRAVEYRWERPPYEACCRWFRFVNESIMEEVFMEDEAAPLSIRYDNGQLCVFRRKNNSNG